MIWKWCVKNGQKKKMLKNKSESYKLISDFWNKISFIGLRDYTFSDALEQFREIVLMNRLLVITVFIMLIYIPIEIIFNSFELVLYILLGLFVFAITLFFNHKKWFIFSKFYFFFACIISILPMMYVVPSGSGNEFLLMPIAIIPALLFKDKWLGLFLFIFVVILFFVVINTRELVDPIVDVTEQQIQFFRNIYLATSFSLVFIVAFYFRKIVNNLEKNNKRKNEELKISNKEITDSINYAKRIQRAILPSDQLITTNFPKSFVLYKPKAIVAGDFYWMHVLHKHIDNEVVLLAAADCTGHGVPGALVSVVCNNALNQTVKEHGIMQPSLILDRTKELVIETFENTKEMVKDGMDIALVSYNKKTLELEYAGANNPLWIIRKNSTEVEVFKADKQPIGFCDNIKPYKNHTIQLGKGDSFYIFSDGYADQFGGEKGKKLKYKPFKELLLAINNLEMQQQCSTLNTYFKAWKGDLEQVDDVCVIGVRV